MVALRPFQTAAVERVIPLLARDPILVGPTGSGKTVMGSEVVRRMCQYPGIHALWVADRRELITQAAMKLRKCGLHVGVLMGSEAADPAAPVQVASIQTLARRDIPDNTQLVVIDECDLAAADSYADVLSIPGAFALGLTATPFRLDGRCLGDMFGEIVVAAQVADLVRDGYLIEPDVLSLPTPWLRSVAVTDTDSGPEFNQDAAARAMSEHRVFGNIVEHWTKHAPGQRTVAFACNIRHSEAIAAAFRAAGWAWAHLDGSTPAKQRDYLLSALASGEIHGISNVNVLTRGWDLPSLGCVIDAAPTMSLNVHLQRCGRVMRPADGKPGGLILDHAGNHHRHGSVMRRLAYSLDGPVRHGVTGEPLGLRRCIACGLHYDVNADQCPECGAAAPSPQARAVREQHGELVDFDDESHEVRAAYWQQCEADRIEQCRKPGWAMYRFKERFGVWPQVMAGDGDARVLINSDDTSNDNKRAVYAHFAAEAVARGYSKGWISHRYRDVFGVWPTGVGASSIENVRRSLAEKWGGE